MLTKHKPKGLRQAKFLGALPRCAVGLGHVQHLAFNTCVGFALCAVTLTQADTIYRCGEAYSASSQCGNSVASEVKPTSALHSTGPNKNDTSSSDLHDAQALEKQRLQLERQATSSAPIRLNTPALAPVSATSTDDSAPCQTPWPIRPKTAKPLLHRFGAQRYTQKEKHRQSGARKIKRSTVTTYLADCCKSRNFASSASRPSTRSGFTGIHATGHTCTH